MTRSVQGDMSSAKKNMETNGDKSTYIQDDSTDH